MQSDVERNLRELQERNRLRREEERRKVSDEERRKRELERGFVTHFSGANQNRQHGSIYPAVSSASNSFAASASMVPSNSSMGPSGSRRRRRTSLHGSVQNERAPLSSLNKSTGHIGSQHGDHRRRANTTFGNVGSQIAAQKNRRQWGRVVEPEFLKPASLPSTRLKKQASSHSDKVSPQSKENSLSMNSSGFLHSSPKGISVNKMHSRRASGSRALLGKHSDDDRGVSHRSLIIQSSNIDNEDHENNHDQKDETEEDYLDDFEIACDTDDNSHEDEDVQSVPEILEILESPQLSNDNDDEVSLLSKSMSLSMSMSRSMNLGLSRLSSWGRSVRQANGDTSTSKSRSENFKAKPNDPNRSPAESIPALSPNIDDLEAGRHIYQSPTRRASKESSGSSRSLIKGTDRSMPDVPVTARRSSRESRTLGASRSKNQRDSVESAASHEQSSLRSKSFVYYESSSSASPLCVGGNKSGRQYLSTSLAAISSEEVEQYILEGQSLEERVQKSLRTKKGYRKETDTGSKKGNEFNNNEEDGDYGVILSPLEDSVHAETTASASPLSRSFVRDEPVKVRSSPIYNRSNNPLSSSSASISQLLDSSLSVSGDERWERALGIVKSSERAVNRSQSAADGIRKLSQSMCVDRPVCTRSAGSLKLREKHVRVAPRGRRLRFNFTDTWGDIYYMGLTGLALLVRNREGKLVEKYPLRKRMKAFPPDINVNGHSGDPRTLDKVIDGWNNTSNEHHMWLIEFNPNEDHVMEIDLGTRHFALAGIRVWNYNKNVEDTRRGVRTAHVTLDGMRLSPSQGLTIRRATGTDEVEFGQTILFEMDADPSTSATCHGDGYMSNVSEEQKEPSSDTSDKTEPRIWQGGDAFKDAPRPPREVSVGSRGAALLHGSLQQDWEVPLLPSGYSLRFDFLDSHGDPTWVGLDKLEIIDARGKPLNMKGYGGRLLVPSKGELDPNWRKPWSTRLTPPDAARPARLYALFDRRITLGALIFWNQSICPGRGVSEVVVYLDNLIIFHGELRSARDAPSQSVVFTSQSSVLRHATEESRVPYCGEKEQSVVFIDNNRSV